MCNEICEMIVVARNMKNKNVVPNLKTKTEKKNHILKMKYVEFILLI
jgi:hypothetical protein